MRTSIEIDDDLMAKAQKASGQGTKKQIVDRLYQWLHASHLRRLRAMLGIEEIIVRRSNAGEVIQGLDSEQTTQRVEAVLRRFDIVPKGEAIAVRAARNFRFLRRRGITIRKTIDLLIGTWRHREPRTSAA